MDYFRPDSLNTALAWLDGNQARVAAGCTDLLPATTTNRLTGPVLDLTGIDELRGISETDTHWRFGATTTWADTIRADLPPAFDSLKLAAREVGSVQIQNAGTLAGNLCNASPAADGVPCWLTLNAEIELQSSAGVRTLPLRAFVIGPRQTALSKGEIVSAILVPKLSAHGVSNFLKLGARKYLIISIAMVAARMVAVNGIITEASISVGSCSAVAARLEEVETLLVGKPFSQDGFACFNDSMLDAVLAPIDDIRSDAGYRMIAAGELVRRCLAGLLTEGAVAV